MLEILRDHWVSLLIGEYPRGPLGGLALTFVMAATSLALTFPSAVLMALARLSHYRVINYPAAGFVYVVRGMPLLMLIFWVYFFLPKILPFPISSFWSVVMSIVVFQTAYLAEVIRAAIEALPEGQTDAARALGLRYAPLMLKVILPQALYNAIPGILNQLTAIIKETSLGYILAVAEVTYTAGQINALLLTKPFQIFALLALIYFAFCGSLTQAAKMLEARIGKSRSPVPV